MSRFPTTQWGSIALAAEPETPEGETALAEVCRVYWYPIYCYIRSRWYSPAEAAELTQEYFLRLLRGRVLAAADSRKGQFRTLLRTDCGHFLSDERERRMAHKRGGRVRILPLDRASADRRYDAEPADRLYADRLFDRAWALDVLGRALARLEAEEAEAGRSAAFALYREALVEGPRAVPHAELARLIGASESAVEGALRRLRRRYRAALRATVSETLRDPTEADVDDEIRDLFAALAR